MVSCNWLAGPNPLPIHFQLLLCIGHPPPRKNARPRRYMYMRLPHCLQADLHRRRCTLFANVTLRLSMPAQSLDMRELWSQTLPTIKIRASLYKEAARAPGWGRQGVYHTVHTRCLCLEHHGGSAPHWLSTGKSAFQPPKGNPIANCSSPSIEGASVHFGRNFRKTTWSRAVLSSLSRKIGKGTVDSRYVVYRFQLTIA